jgi:copper chaperone CopZ
LLTVPGVREVDVSFGDKTAVVEGRDVELGAMLRALKEVGKGGRPFPEPAPKK